MNDLKTCPFCGGDAEILVFKKHIFDKRISDACVECKECGAGTMKYYPTKEMAVEAWNKRK